MFFDRNAFINWFSKPGTVHLVFDELVKDVVDVCRCGVFVSEVHESAPVPERNVVVCESLELLSECFMHQLCDRYLISTWLTTTFILATRTSHDTVVGHLDRSHTTDQG